MHRILDLIKQKWLALHDRYGNRLFIVVFAGLFILIFIFLLINLFAKSSTSQQFGKLPRAVPTPIPEERVQAPQLPDQVNKYSLTTMSPDLQTKSLLTYQVSSGISPTLLESIAEKLGFNRSDFEQQDGEFTWFTLTGDTLQSFPAYGYLQYKTGDFSRFVVGSVLEDKDLLQKKAREHLFNLGLITSITSKELFLVRISYLAGQGHVSNVLLRKDALLAEICFNYQPISGREVLFTSYNPTPICLWLGGNDSRLAYLTWRVPYQKIDQSSEYSVIKLEDAWKNVTSGKAWVAYFSQMEPQDESSEWGEFYTFKQDQFETISIDSAKLGYLVTPQESGALLVPVWVFSGKARVVGKSADFYLKLYVQAS